MSETTFKKFSEFLTAPIQGRFNLREKPSYEEGLYEGYLKALRSFLNLPCDTIEEVRELFACDLPKVIDQYHKENQERIRRVIYGKCHEKGVKENPSCPISIEDLLDEIVL